MNAVITKIDKLKSGNMTSFIRVYFRPDDRPWAKTDLGVQFRNFARWKPHLQLGAKLSGLRWKNEKENTIDADSNFTRTGTEPQPPTAPTQMNLL